MSAIIPARMRFEVLERDEFTCQYCGARAPDTILHVDHVVAHSNGGPTSPDNLITACRDCNFGKAGSDLRFVPDHIMERAGNAYERGQAIRAAVRPASREACVPSPPRQAPAEVVEQITSGADALSVSIEAHRLTQAYVAGAIGVSEGYLSLLRSGKRRIPEKLVGPICAATGSNLLRQYRDLQDALAETCERREVDRLATMLREAA